MRVAFPSVATAALLALAGCGSGDDPSKTQDEAGVRATMIAYLDDFTNARFADVCKAMAPAVQVQTGRGDASHCQRYVAIARAIITDQQIAGLDRAARRATITVHGERALTPAFAGMSATRWEYADGRWLVAPPALSLATDATAARARTWPARWCSAQIGITEERLAELMGPPTTAIEPQTITSSPSPSAAWSFGHYHFEAGFDLAKQARALTIDESRLTPTEKAAIHCSADRD
jgi:hypothetical protein